MIMEKANKEIRELFKAFAHAPMEKFLEIFLTDLTREQMDSFVIDDVSYHRDNSRFVSLGAWLYMKPLADGISDKWICIDYTYDTREESVEIHYCIRDFVRMESLAECINYYIGRKNDNTDATF